MTLVVDASLIVAALIDDGRNGRWADQTLESDDLAAPHLMPAEAANILRRLVLSGDLSADNASLAHHDLTALTVQLFPYEPFASRTWELRENVTCYDAWYIALAESLDATVATLDLNLAKAPGPRCEFITPLTEGDNESPDAAQ